MSRKFSMDEFLKEVKEVPNLLLGNGFSLSHPTLNKAFEWKKDTVFTKDSIPEIFEFESANSPELDLSIIRRKILKKILLFYIQNLCNLLKQDKRECINDLFTAYKYPNLNKFHCDRFLDDRRNIFTINYDPILYFEILKRKDKYFDGFITKNDNGEYDNCLQEFYHGDASERAFSKQEYIKCKLQNYSTYKVAKIYYLHGS